jgi:hypothetical protein
MKALQLGSYDEVIVGSPQSTFIVALGGNAGLPVVRTPEQNSDILTGPT